MSLLSNNYYSTILNNLISKFSNIHIIISHLENDVATDTVLNLKQSLNCSSKVITCHNLDILLCLLSEVDGLFIGDWDLMHLAALFNKPQLILFAGVLPSQWSPMSNNHKILYDKDNVNNI